MYIIFYIWMELMPDDEYWWSVPTYVLLYAVGVVSLFIAIGEFTKARPK